LSYKEKKTNDSLACSWTSEPFRFQSTDCIRKTITQQVFETIPRVVVDHVAA